jgi:hypothetical protein
VIESQTKEKRKITWRRQVLDPLGKGNGSTHPRQNHVQAKSTNYQPKLKKYKELPLHTCKLPLNQCNSPWTNACEPPHETEQLHQLSSHWSDRSPSLVRLVDKIAQHLGTTPVRPVPLTGQADTTWETARAQNSLKPPQNLLNACNKPFQAQTSPPCWQCMNKAKNAKNST